MEFQATHLIDIVWSDGRSEQIPVMCDDFDSGPCYTAQEWRDESTADWELVASTLVFQGHIPNAQQYSITVVES